MGCICGYLHNERIQLEHHRLYRENIFSFIKLCKKYRKLEEEYGQPALDEELEQENVRLEMTDFHDSLYQALVDRSDYGNPDPERYRVPQHFLDYWLNVERETTAREFVHAEENQHPERMLDEGFEGPDYGNNPEHPVEPEQNNDPDEYRQDSPPDLEDMGDMSAVEGILAALRLAGYENN